MHTDSDLVFSLNREAWLTDLAAQVRPMFKGFRMGTYRLTCGWPSVNAIGKGAIRIGECHGPYDNEQEGVFDIFISPILDDSIDVAGTVVHEMAHIAAGLKAKHGPFFKKVCKHVGLTKNKATSASPGPRLTEKLAKIVEVMGKYPHTKIKLVAKKIKPASSTALCCENCGCKIMISFKWLESTGAPTCGCGGSMKAKEDTE